MLGHPLKRFPAQIQPIEIGIAVLQHCQNADRLFIMLEPAILRHAARQCLLTGMTKRRVTQIMRQRHRLGQIIIQP